MSVFTSRKKIFDFSQLRRVLQYTSPYKKWFYGSITLSILLAVISPLRPFLIQFTVNVYIRGGLNADLGIRDRMIQMLIYVTILQIGILLIETLLRFYFSFITAWLGQTVVKDLRIAVYKKVLSLNLSQYDKTPIGTLDYAHDQ